MNKDDYGRAIIAEGRRRGITPRGIQIALSTALVESNLVMYANANDPPSMNLPHEAVSYDGSSTGLFQQQAFGEWGTVQCRMDAACSAGQFYDHLVNKSVTHGADYNDTSISPGTFAQWVQRSAFPNRYDARFAAAVDLYNRLAGVPAVTAPAYSERAQWSPNASGRGGNHPTLFLLHTQEGAGDAASLANFLGNPNSQVSYHYTVDNGVDVVDVVDTDEESWSVLDANAYSINLCFAGSTVNWSRQQWLDLMGNGIRVAAYIAVQDCRKYGIPTNVIAPPYHQGSGISDHKYVTQQLGIGSHVDVGNNFPWDVFTNHVNEYANPQGDDMAAVPQDQWDRVYFELTNRWPSRSPFRALGEGAVDTAAGMILNTDGMVHAELIERLAVTYNDPASIQRLKDIAAADPAQFPDRLQDAALAKRILAKIPT